MLNIIIKALFLILLAPYVVGIYADQVGEVEFLKKLIGEPSTSNTIAHDGYFYTTTSRGVLACLNQDSGELRWRNVIQDAPINGIIIAKSVIITLSNQGGMLRAWNLNTGFLLWETLIQAVDTNSDSDITDLSYDPVSNVVNVLAKNTIYFYNLAGNLKWQFNPEKSYSSSSVKLSKRKSQSGAGGELKLIISQLAHQIEMVPDLITQDMYAAVGCYVSSKQPQECTYTAVIKINHFSKSTELIGFPVLHAAPPSIRSNIRAVIGKNAFEETDVIYTVVDKKSLNLLHLSAKSTSNLVVTPIPNADETIDVDSFVLQAIGKEIAYAGVIVCSHTGGCSTYVYFPHADDGGDSKGLFSLGSCQGEAAGQHRSGLARSRYHTRVASSVTCAYISGGSRDLATVTSTLTDNRVVAHYESSISIPSSISTLALSSLNTVLSPVDNKLSFVLSLSYGEVLVVAGNQVKAIREESLAYIQDAIMVDNPVKANRVNGDIPSFLTRLELQVKTLQRFWSKLNQQIGDFFNLILTTSPGTIIRKVWHGEFKSQRKGADELFGFNKLTICATSLDSLETIKIVAIDMLNEGAVVGSYLPVLPIGETIKSVKFLRHDKDDEHVLFAALAVSGKAFLWDIKVSELASNTPLQVVPQPSIVLEHDILKRVLNLAKLTKNGHNIYALVFEGGVVSTYPPLPLEETKKVFADFYIHDLPSADNQGVFTSSLVDSSSCKDNGGDIGATCQSFPVASAVFPSHSEKILDITYPTAGEIPASRANTLGDHSLLLKYINPHALVVTSVATEDSGDTNLIITVLDGVSARILYRSSQQYGDKPVHAVFIENHIFVTYLNKKAQRVEMSSIVLYEGMVGKYDLGPLASGNSFANEGSFSSFTALPPIALQKTFIMPKAVSTLHRTFTKVGLSNKNLLVATTSGQIQSFDVRWVHPRRPLAEPSKTEKEESLLQYSPFLHLHPTSYITYNSTVMGLQNIISTTSNLESTSLILGYGLDIFYNHHKPSQNFDLLSSDFNHSFLVAILTILFFAVLIARSVAQRKNLSVLWM